VKAGHGCWALRGTQLSRSAWLQEGQDDLRGLQEQANQDLGTTHKAANPLAEFRHVSEEYKFCVRGSDFQCRWYRHLFRAPSGATSSGVGLGSPDSKHMALTESTGWHQLSR
jgi:hypothetical protein